MSTTGYVCPLCGSALTQGNNTFSCSNNHQFDVAKEGYVNLLPVQMKKSKQPGDNLEMVQARRAFLEKNHYRFLADKIAERVASHSKFDAHVYDLGCGEGYYTHIVAETTPEAEVYGVDISKSAVRYAAKRYNSCHFSVASIKQAPFATASADVITSVFAPLFEQELARLAAPGAMLIVASPGPSHLKELKQRIYETVHDHTPVPCPNGFVLASQNIVEKHVILDVEDAVNLIKMTPFAWKFTPHHWQEIEQCKQLEVTLSFYISEFQKQA